MRRGRQKGGSMAKRKIEELKPEKQKKEKETKQAEKQKTDQVEKEISFEEEDLIAKNRSYMSESDYLEFTKLTISRKIKIMIGFWSLLSIVFGALILAVTFIVDDTINIVQFILGGVLIIIGGVFAYYFYVKMPQGTANSYYQNDLKYLDTFQEKPYKTYEFYETGVQTRTADGRGNKVLYEDIEKTYESKNLFVFTLSLQHGYVLKKDGFQQGDFDQVKKLIEEQKKDEKKKDKMPRTNGCIGKL